MDNDNYNYDSTDFYPEGFAKEEDRAIRIFVLTAFFLVSGGGFALGFIVRGWIG